jgi:alkylation response protein AidB-like acyl-CoA dehydrogenase
MAIRTYVTESAAYRAGQNIEDNINRLVAEGLSKEQAILKGVEQFAVECAIMKVHGSEILDYVVDEGVQVYGGMGFSADAPMERAYRDARITRIYEGTNEINRMLLVGMIFKRAMSGQLDLFGPAMAVAKELMAPPAETPAEEGLFAAEHLAVRNLKKAILMVAGKAAQDLGAKLNDEQELLMLLADMIIETYAAESVLLRAHKLALTQGEAAAHLPGQIAQVYLYEAADKVYLAGKEAIAAFAKPDSVRGLMSGLKRFAQPPVVNTTALRREIAAALLDKNAYAF